MEIVNARSKDKGGGTMKRFLRRIHRGNRGFTLVEMLIVVAIIAVLSGVILPRFVGVVEHTQTEAAKAELEMVQTAMDAMMAKEGITSVTEVTAATASMDGFPDSTYPLYPSYFRTATTSENYTCTTTGLISQQ